MMMARCEVCSVQEGGCEVGPMRMKRMVINEVVDC